MMTSDFNVGAFGARGDGITDDTDAFYHCRRAIEDTVRTSLAFSNRHTQAAMIVPPGVYRITAGSAFIDDKSPKSSVGFEIRGSGMTNTLIQYDPKTNNAVFINNKSSWMLGSMSDLTFHSTNPASVFWHSEVQTGAVQGWDFRRVAWVGEWHRMFDLRGTNNNSEYSFTDCRTAGIIGVFLYVGSTDTSDQFLNYWFTRGKFWHSGRFIEMHRGGNISVRDCDFSGWNWGTAFTLAGRNHAQGVCRFLVSGSRFELKGEGCRVIDCEWPQGIVTFDNCDWSSQAPWYNGNNISAEFRSFNNPGPLITFRESMLIGTHHYAGDKSPIHQSCSVVYENCSLLSFDDPYQHVRLSSGKSTTGYQAVEFRNIRGRLASCEFVRSGIMRSRTDLISRNFSNQEFLACLEASKDPAPDNSKSVVILPPHAILTRVRIRVPSGHMIYKLEIESMHGVFSILAEIQGGEVLRDDTINLMVPTSDIIGRRVRFLVSGNANVDRSGICMLYYV